MQAIPILKDTAIMRLLKIIPKKKKKLQAPPAIPFLNPTVKRNVDPNLRQIKQKYSPRYYISSFLTISSPSSHSRHQPHHVRSTQVCDGSGTFVGVGSTSSHSLQTPYHVRSTHVEDAGGSSVVVGVDVVVGTAGGGVMVESSGRVVVMVEAAVVVVSS